MSYGYDSFGNMTQVPGATPLAASLDYDANNRYLRGSPALEANFSCVGVNGEAGYDAAGNLACWGTPGTNAQAWTWDAESRQTRQYAQQNNNAYLLSRNTYDANGQRVRADHFTPSGTNDSFREYSFFNGEMLTEKDQRGYWTDYVYAFGRKIGRIDPFNIAFWTTGDQVGTTQLEFDRNATLTYRGEFMPFGQELSTGPTTNRFKFTGKERDPESGLDYFGARYYSSGLGRFLSPDWSDEPEAVPYASLRNPQTLNLYGYGLNNPLINRDFDGHSCDPDYSTTDSNGTTTVHAGKCHSGGWGIVSLAAAIGHHFIPQSVYKDLKPNSYAYQFARKFVTGKLKDNAVNRYDKAHRAYNQAIRKLLDAYRDRTGKTLEEFKDGDFREIAKEIEGAEGDVKVFINRMEASDPAIKTAVEAAEDAFQAVKNSPEANALEEAGATAIEEGMIPPP